MLRSLTELRSYSILTKDGDRRRVRHRQDLPHYRRLETVDVEPRLQRREQARPHQRRAGHQVLLDRQGRQRRDGPLRHSAHRPVRPDDDR